jgi:hypothetical protein
VTQPVHRMLMTGTILRDPLLVGASAQHARDDITTRDLGVLPPRVPLDNVCYSICPYTTRKVISESEFSTISKNYYPQTMHVVIAKCTSIYVCTTFHVEHFCRARTTGGDSRPDIRPGRRRQTVVVTALEISPERRDPPEVYLRIS